MFGSVSSAVMSDTNIYVKGISYRVECDGQSPDRCSPNMAVSISHGSGSDIRRHVVTETSWSQHTNSVKQIYNELFSTTNVVDCKEK